MQFQRDAFRLWIAPVHPRVCSFSPDALFVVTGVGLFD
jgi:hypothetical protein